MGFKSPWAVFMLGVGLFFIVMSNFGAASGSTMSIGLLFGGVLIVIVSGIYLFVTRKKR
ncbi:MAG: hypothetical protein Q4B77_04110 [Coriobacteriaceae bacterium]|nr:hypothetical protein [Coriobacteriaceae bacterium]